VKEFAPTPRLRFIIKAVGDLTLTQKYGYTQTARVLQQWWAPDVPMYMADPTEGEWRDVALEGE
jgi:hypothetical protein